MYSEMDIKYINCYSDFKIDAGLYDPFHLLSI